jgi:hypothetical protein
MTQTLYLKMGYVNKRIETWKKRAYATIHKPNEIQLSKQ